MPGTRAGGSKATKTNKERYGDDHYEKLGHKGGTAIHTKPRGFAANRSLASKAGRIGGSRSKQS